MSFFSFVVAPPAFFVLRKLIRRVYAHRAQPVPRRHPHPRDAAGNAAGHPHRQGLHARRHHARALRPQRRRGRARSQQDGARLQPLQPADGDARRLRHRHRHHLWRLSRDRDRRDARPVLLLHRRLPAGLRAGQAPGAPQYRAQQRAGRRAHPVRGASTSPPSEPSDVGKPALRIKTPRLEFDDVHFAYRQRRGGARRHVVRRRARQADRAGRAVRRRQVDRYST